MSSAAVEFVRQAQRAWRFDVPDTRVDDGCLGRYLAPVARTELTVRGTRGCKTRQPRRVAPAEWTIRDEHLVFVELDDVVSGGVAKMIAPSVTMRVGKRARNDDYVLAI